MTKQYDLEERTLQFAKNVRELIKILQKTLANREDASQLVRSSGSIGANYIEANDAISKKDFIHRIKISRKEAKETRYWLQLIDTRMTATIEKQRQILLQESTELMNILSAIMRSQEI